MPERARGRQSRGPDASIIGCVGIDYRHQVYFLDFPRGSVYFGFLNQGGKTVCAMRCPEVFQARGQASTGRVR